MGEKLDQYDWLRGVWFIIAGMGLVNLINIAIYGPRWAQSLAALVALLHCGTRFRARFKADAAEAQERRFETQLAAERHWNY